MAKLRDSVRVTNHALLRYIERHMGIDVEAVRSELCAMALDAVPLKDGEHYWSAADDLMLIIARRDTIVTVLSPEDMGKHRGRKLRNGERIPNATAAHPASDPTAGSTECPRGA